jgi:hypothetical protein
MILNDELLTEPLREHLAGEARNDIVDATRGIADQ